MIRLAPFPGLPGNRADSSKAKLARMSAGTGEDQAASAPAAPEPTGMVQAGAGRQTIYRWWPSKGAVAAEAMARQARVIVPVRDTTSFADDLTQFLVDSFTGLEDSAMRRVLRHLLAAGAAGLPDAAQPSRPGEGG
jgi:hypothetical protein